MKIKKRHIVLAALIIALGAAVYLNWRFSDTSSMISPSSKELGKATYVSADASATNDEAKTASKALSASDEYFAKAATDREQAQDKALSIAKDTLTLSDSSDDAKEEAAEQLKELEDRILAQSNIEGILKTKGFSKCLCFLSDEGCSVAVLKDEIKENSPLIIKDAVQSQYEIDFNKITVLEV